MIRADLEKNNYHVLKISPESAIFDAHIYKNKLILFK